MSCVCGIASRGALFTRCLGIGCAVSDNMPFLRCTLLRTATALRPPHAHTTPSPTGIAFHTVGCCTRSGCNQAGGNRLGVPAAGVRLRLPYFPALFDVCFISLLSSMYLNANRNRYIHAHTRTHMHTHAHTRTRTNTQHTHKTITAVEPRTHTHTPYSIYISPPSPFMLLALPPCCMLTCAPWTRRYIINPQPWQLGTGL